MNNSRVYTYICTYLGSKLRMIGDIELLAPTEAIELIEVCGGLGSYSLNNRKFNTVTYNEINTNIFNVLSVLQNPNEAEVLIKKITEAKVNKNDFLLARKMYDDDFAEISGKIEKAYMVLVLQLYSYNGGKLSYIERQREEAWKRNTRERLNEVTKALKNIEIENRNCFDIMNEVKDDKDIFILYDMPYPFDSERTTNNIYGKYDWTQEDHKKNVEFLKPLNGDIGCKIMVTTYSSPTYDKLLESGYWNKIKIMEAYSPSGKSGCKRKIKNEYVYINYACIHEKAEYIYPIDIESMKERRKIIR